MRRVAALLAAVLASLAVAGCGGDGAEPGAPRSATLVLSDARIHALDSNYGPTGWVGLAEPCFHCSRGNPTPWTHGHAKLNSYYSETDASWQGIACQEIGHVIGLDHGDHGDCMAKRYFSPSSNNVGSTSVNHIRNYYASPPDGSLGHVQGYGTSDKESDWYDFIGYYF